jgi:hypothetical protein
MRRARAKNGRFYDGLLLLAVIVIVVTVLHQPILSALLHVKHLAIDPWFYSTATSYWMSEGYYNPYTQTQYVATTTPLATLTTITFPLPYSPTPATTRTLPTTTYYQTGYTTQYTTRQTTTYPTEQTTSYTTQYTTTYTTETVPPAGTSTTETTPSIPPEAEKAVQTVKSLLNVSVFGIPLWALALLAVLLLVAVAVIVALARWAKGGSGGGGGGVVIVARIFPLISHAV